MTRTVSVAFAVLLQFACDAGVGQARGGRLGQPLFGGAGSASRGSVRQFETGVRPLMSQYYSTRSAPRVDPYPVRLRISGADFLAAARSAFARGDLEAALRLARHAEIEMPEDADVHQFLSLVHFSRADYEKAGEAARDALKWGDAWDWPELRRQYARAKDYAPDLRALEKHVRAHPGASTARFLLGYHYLMLGHAASAERELSAAVTLKPGDRAAGQLLEKLQRADRK